MSGVFVTSSGERSIVCVVCSRAVLGGLHVPARMHGMFDLFGRVGRIKGVVEITPIFETISCRACHYAISKLCQGMRHHYGAGHVPPRPHIHQFRPWAPVPLPGVCFLTDACGSPIAYFERFCSPAGWSCGTRA